jgi:hypothetical protein
VRQRNAFGFGREQDLRIFGQALGQCFRGGLNHFGVAQHIEDGDLDAGRDLKRQVTRQPANFTVCVSRCVMLGSAAGSCTLRF